MSPETDPRAYDVSQPTAYALRLSKIVEKYLVFFGVVIGLLVASILLAGASMLLVVNSIGSIDNTKDQMCAGFEDLIEKALGPIVPVEGGTPEQVENTENANRQRAEKAAALKRELAAHSDCQVSLNE